MGMKRNILVGAAVGTTVFGAVFGLAAGLEVSSQDKIGSGQAAVTSCDTDGVTTSYLFDGATNVTGVTVSGISDQCDGAEVSVAAFHGNESEALSKGTNVAMTFALDEEVENNSAYVTFIDPVSAALLDTVTVTLHGGHSPDTDYDIG